MGKRVRTTGPSPIARVLIELWNAVSTTVLPPPLPGTQRAAGLNRRRGSLCERRRTECSSWLL